MSGQSKPKKVVKTESVDITERLSGVDFDGDTVVVMDLSMEEVPKPEEPPVVVETPKVRHAIGEVHNCGILKVRKVANAKSEVVTVINRGTRVQIDFEGSSETFYKVTVGKVSGFSMKEYIKIVE